jgi:isoleucyl-tRNA synthetase
MQIAEPDFSLLQSLGDDLRFVMITSSAHIEPSNDPLKPLSIHVQASQNPKCSRCWHHVSDVGADSNHPELCGRCISNLFGAGEDRQFA